MISGYIYEQSKISITRKHRSNKQIVQQSIQAALHLFLMDNKNKLSLTSQQGTRTCKLERLR